MLQEPGTYLRRYGLDHLHVYSSRGESLATFWDLSTQPRDSTNSPLSPVQ